MEKENRMKVYTFVQGELYNNSYLITDSQNAYIIDPSSDPQELVLKIRDLNLKFQGVILTHFHLDHIEGISKLNKCKIYVSKRDYDVLISKETIFYMSENFFRHGYMSAENCEKLREKFLVSDVVFAEDGFIIPNFENKFHVIATPGHSIGSLCLYCAEKKILFSGDTLFYHSYGRTDLPFSNYRDMVCSLKKLSMLPGDTKVYPGHGRETVIEEEIKRGYLCL